MRELQNKVGLRSPIALALIARALIVLIIASLLLAGCGRPDPQPLRFRDVPWRAGDTTLFDITDIDGNYAGTTIFTIQQSESSADNNWLVSRETYAQEDHEWVEVEIRGDQLYPLRSKWSLENGSGVETIEATYDDGEVSMTLTSKQQQMHTEKRTVPTNSFDAYTLLMLLRALPLDNDYATQLSLFTSLTGQLEVATVSVLKQEEIATEMGDYQTWVVEIRKGESRSKAWVGTEMPYPVVKYIDARNGGTYLLSSFEAGK